MDAKDLPNERRRAQLVVDLTLHVRAERALLQGVRMSGGPDRAGLHAESLELAARARVEKLIGIANCLTQCTGFLEGSGPLNAAGFGRAIDRLSELVEQVRTALAPVDRAFVDEAVAPAAAIRPDPPVPKLDFALPRMVTVLSPAKAPADGPAVELPPLRPVPETPLVAKVPPPRTAQARAVETSATMLSTRDLEETASVSPAEEAGTAARDVAPERMSGGSPPGGSQPGPPHAKVRSTMFGLRAFRQQGEPPAQASTAGRQSGTPLLGLQPGFARSNRPPSQDPAPLIAATPPPLPPLRNEPAAPGAPGGTWMRQVFERGRRARRRRPEESNARRSDLPEGNIRSKARSPDWVLIGVAALALGAAGVASIVVWNRLHDSNEQQESAAQPPLASAPSVAVSGVPPTASATAPSAEELDSEAALAALREKAHASGAESPELRAWIDEQAVLQAKLLETGRCEGSAAACAPLLKAREELQKSRRGGNVGSVRRSVSAGDMRPRWLLGLSLPEQFPIDDHERVEFLFEKYSDTPTGRAAFESLLFRCGKYRELVQATLIRYELPPSLFAVVYAESGCNPLAKSPVGAEGLWQFMPEAAKAYHLRIIEDVVDERHSPQKSTEAAIHFLADLYRKFKSWDLVFAAYNMGPYGLAARMHVAGGDDVSFWDLLDADLVPNETANYVPTIEAFALISENLARLKFAGAQVAPPEVTARLDVPPGTRLSLIARAASTSVTQLRQLNPDLKADAVPNLRGELFPIEVIKDVAPQAREALKELIERRAVGHLCVPEGYDWGKEQYTAEMEEACKRKLSGGASAPTPQ